jgi:hypothetical protein
MEIPDVPGLDRSATTARSSSFGVEQRRDTVGDNLEDVTGCENTLASDRSSRLKF